MKFHADQRVRVKEGFFKGKVAAIYGYRVKDKWWQFWLPKEIHYKLSFNNQYYFSESQLEAVE